MIIGKGGNYIKQIKEQSGSYVQISQKAKELSLQERCITVVGQYYIQQSRYHSPKPCIMGIGTRRYHGSLIMGTRKYDRSTTWYFIICIAYYILS